MLTTKANFAVIEAPAWVVCWGGIMKESSYIGSPLLLKKSDRLVVWLTPMTSAFEKVSWNKYKLS